MKLKENFIKGKGAVSRGALLINIPLQVQRLHYSGVTHAQEGGNTHTHTRQSSLVDRDITIGRGQG